jgi:RecA-family ATPase
MLDLADLLVEKYGLNPPDRARFEAVRSFLDRNSTRFIGLEKATPSRLAALSAQQEPAKVPFALPAAIDVVQMGRTAAKPLDFVLPGLVAGTTGTLFSPGATGKSFLMLQTAVAIACADLPGTDLLDWHTHHEGGLRAGKVLYVAGEDPPPVLHVRLHAIIDALAKPRGPGLWRLALDAALRRNLQVIPTMGSKLDLLDDLHVDLLSVAAAGARLIVLDTLSRVHTADENSNGAMSSLVRNFERITSETGAALIFLHHVAKAAAREQKGDEQHASRGASVLVDNARWGASISKMSKAEAETLGLEEDQRHHYVKLAIPKNNYSAPFESVWFERRQGGVLACARLDGQAEEPADSERAFRMAHLRHKFRGGPPPEPLAPTVAAKSSSGQREKGRRNGAI